MLCLFPVCTLWIHLILMKIELKNVLGMEKLPRKIETYDISNISGEYMVAAMCVMQDGVIKKNLSRRFKIKTVYSQDDPKCMEEVITRRLKHSIDNPNGGFGKLPDAIFADGGITQIRATKKAIEKYKELGAEVEEFSLDIAQYSLATYYIIACAEASSNLGRFDGIRYGYRTPEFKNLKELYKKSRSEGFGEEVKRRIILGTYVLS